MTTSDTITGMYNEAKIEYDNTAIYKDDSGTRLITALGNYKDKKQEFITFCDTEPDNLTLKKGRIIEIPINVDKVWNEDKGIYEIPEGAQTKKYEILDTCNTSSGFNGVIMKDLSTDKIILWADGTKGYKNLATINPLVYAEFVADWANNIVGIGSGNIFTQLDDLRAFALKYNNEHPTEKIDIGIGQSMMGIGMSALGISIGFEDMEVHTYSGCVTPDLRQAVSKKWGLNNLDGANITSYYTPDEILLRKLEPYQGNNKIYIKSETHESGLSKHSASAYHSLDGNDGVYYRITSFNRYKFPSWDAKIRLNIAPSSIVRRLGFNPTSKGRKSKIELKKTA